MTLARGLRIISPHYLENQKRQTYKAELKKYNLLLLVLFFFASKEIKQNRLEDNICSITN